jgi:hypothetical protein
VTSEHRDLCRKLNVFEPGILPNDVFHAIARLVVLPTLVVIPLIRQGDRIMVSLQVRGASDPHYASMLHPPGAVIRPSDASMSAVYNRLIAAELPDATVKRGPVFVYAALDAIARGREISLVHWIELAESSTRSDLFDTDPLPALILPTDYARIAAAVLHFEAFRTAQ